MRPPWNSYFMQLARHASTRGTCPRRQVGCVLVRSNRVLATGFNGSITGAIHCDQNRCLMRNGHCIRTVHAEANAVAQAAWAAGGLKGATAYTTTFPCMSCFKLLVQAGVLSIYYAEEYPHPEVEDTKLLAASAGIELKHLPL